MKSSDRICVLFYILLHIGVFVASEHYGVSSANNHIKRLYDDLLVGYNRLIRPVHNNSDQLTVFIRLKLSQIIDVDEKNQVMTVNVWVRQEWHDYKLAWNPEEYGGVERVYIPSEAIWTPDIVLYNNADGNYETHSLTKATLRSDGTVIWEPPAIYKSSCLINVEYFPFDEQQCSLVFGSWTYDGKQVDLLHKCSEMEPPRYKNRPIEFGSDLRRIAQNGEWDILSIPAVRRERYYPCCTNPVPELTFNITIRRRTLFYTVNLIIPCVGICFLTVLVFYLPSDSGEKVTLCISILLSLTLFFLLLAEIIPPTSMAVPLIGKYILFTMVLVTLSICVTVMVLNVHHRSPLSHEMPDWVRLYMLYYLPKLLGMRRFTHGYIRVDALCEYNGGLRNNSNVVGHRQQQSAHYFDHQNGADFFYSSPHQYERESIMPVGHATAQRHLYGNQPHLSTSAFSNAGPMRPPRRTREQRAAAQRYAGKCAFAATLLFEKYNETGNEF